MINNQFINTFVGPHADVMYVFGDLDSTDFLSICHQNAALPPKISQNVDLFVKGRLVGPRKLMMKTMQNRSYNEIAIRRKRTDGTRVMPTAILCYDKINDASIRYAEYFNIPIIVINTKTYRNLQNYMPAQEIESRKRM